MSLKLKGPKLNIDVRQQIDHYVAQSNWLALGMILGLCVINIIACVVMSALGNFLVNLTHISFHGYVTGSLFALIHMIRNLAVTLIVYDLILKKDVLKLDENIRYVMFLVLNFIVYAVTGVFVYSCIGSYGLLFLLESPLDYTGISAVFRFISMMINMKYMISSDVMMFITYMMYMMIDIMSLVICTGWVIKLLADEASEHDLSLKEALLKPFTSHKEDDYTISEINEMTFETDESDEIVVDTSLSPVSEDLVDLYCTVHHDYFGTDKMILVRNRLMTMTESEFEMATSIDYVNPDMMLFVSCLSGSFGLDRFLLGETAVGLLKLLTFGCFGILTLIDLLTIRKKTQELNFNKIMSI